MGMYETIFILDSLLVPEEIEKIIENVKKMIESNGGKVITVDKWGKRRLAYEIQKKQYGFYVAIEFEGEGPIPNALEHEYNFNDKVLRYLTYHYTKNKMKARAKEMEMKKSEPKGLHIEESKTEKSVSHESEHSDKKAVGQKEEKAVDEEVENA